MRWLAGVARGEVSVRRLSAGSGALSWPAAVRLRRKSPPPRHARPKSAVAITRATDLARRLTFVGPARPGSGGEIAGLPRSPLHSALATVVDLPGRRKITILAAGTIGVITAGAAVAAASLTGSPGAGTPGAGSGTGHRGAVGDAKVVAPKRLASPGVTRLATLRGPAPRYSSPGRRAAGTVPASWYSYPSVLPVIASRPGWVRVRLAQRPDGSTTWLPDKDVGFSSTPYHIVINLADTHLSLYKHGRLVFSTPAGVGTTDDPTPPGQYFVAFIEPPPSSAYGAFVMVTSDHSDVIKNWEGSGDAVIGIHGPLGADQAIGTTGARISHGCIRLHEPDLLRLRGVPPGTPITITD